jgi:hypothetical protein
VVWLGSGRLSLGWVVGEGVLVGLGARAGLLGTPRSVAEHSDGFSAVGDWFNVRWVGNCSGYSNWHARVRGICVIDAEVMISGGC